MQLPLQQEDGRCALNLNVQRTRPTASCPLAVLCDSATKPDKFILVTAPASYKLHRGVVQGKGSGCQDYLCSKQSGSPALPSPPHFMLHVLLSSSALVAYAHPN